MSDSAREELALSGSWLARGSDHVQRAVRKAVAERMNSTGISANDVHRDAGVNAGQLRQFMAGKTRMTLGNLSKLEDWLEGRPQLDRQSNALAHCADSISHRLIFGNGTITRADLNSLARHLRASK